MDKPGLFLVLLLFVGEHGLPLLVHVLEWRGPWRAGRQRWMLGHLLLVFLVMVLDKVGVSYLGMSYLWRSYLRRTSLRLSWLVIIFVAAS